MNTPLIEKIKKLLRLAGCKGATASEASLALSKAQALAAEHGINLTEISTGEDQSSPGLTHVSVPSQAGIPQNLAAQIVKRHFGVEILFEKGGSKPCAHIIGTPSQAQLAEYVYVFLVRTIRQSWRARTNRRLKNRESFLRGFAYAISAKLPATFPQTGLILSRESYINEKILQPGQKIKTNSGPKKPPAISSMSEGFKAGRKTQIHNALRGSDTLNLN